MQEGGGLEFRKQLLVDDRCNGTSRFMKALIDGAGTEVDPLPIPQKGLDFAARYPQVQGEIDQKAYQPGAEQMPFAQCYTPSVFVSASPESWQGKSSADGMVESGANKSSVAGASFEGSSQGGLDCHGSRDDGGRELVSGDCLRRSRASLRSANSCLLNGRRSSSDNSSR